MTAVKLMRTPLPQDRPEDGDPQGDGCARRSPPPGRVLPARSRTAARPGRDKR